MNGKNRRSKPSRAICNSLNMDLDEIVREHALRYLPAKALHRSLSVCRDWKLQISAPFFVHNQSVSFRSISGFFYQSPKSPPSFISLDQMAYGVPDPQLKFLPELVDIRSSSNGLLLCQGRTGERVYYVCNPVNGQWKKLPKPLNDHGKNPSIVLVCEPSVLNFVAEFKVVSLFPSTDIENAYEFEIYFSSQDTWKFGEMYFANSSLAFTGGIYVNGVTYWPSRGKTLVFDVMKERASEIYGHGSYYYGYSYREGSSSCMGAYNGKLCSTSINNQAVTVQALENMYVNTMPSHSKAQQWANKHHSVLDTKDFKHEGCEKPKVLLSWDNIIAFQVGSKVFSYDIKSRRITALNGDSKLPSDGAVFPYVNSLVSMI